MAKAEEEMWDSSPEREGEVAKLKALNARFLRESVEKRGQVAVLTTCVDELSVDVGALADWEHEVLRDALAGPLLDAAEEAATLRASLAAIQEALKAVEEGAARETEARGKGTVRLEVAVEEKRQVPELLGAKEAAASKQVTKLEAWCSNWRGSELSCVQRQVSWRSTWGEMQASARRLQAQKAEVEEEFKKNTKMYK